MLYYYDVILSNCDGLDEQLVSNYFKKLYYDVSSNMYIYYSYFVFQKPWEGCPHQAEPQSKIPRGGA